VREAGEHQPYAVVLKISEGHVAQAGVFVVADLVFGVLVLTTLFKDLDVSGRGVGKNRVTSRDFATLGQG
jgi:hypothetical protein